MSVSSFFIKLFSKKVGEDECGNSYYLSGKRRFVIYKGAVEPTKVPPMWHAWLHFLSDDLPSSLDLKKHDWQKPYSPNLTGTKEAYSPRKKSVSSDYSPWTPNN
ncbi:MAG: NADH-ubiquinone oxidoreductase subunit NDUFA12 family protein [Rickettsiaceae bacterium]|nr:NADH-ubiquinone oxidoreductase subunit NDUFA12 family protein [Rickettsiaceae bacterium]